MHIVLAVIGIVTAVYFFVIRARNAAEMTSMSCWMSRTTFAPPPAGSGFGVTRKCIPVEAIEDPNTAAATLATAYLELHGLTVRRHAQYAEH